MKVKLFKVDIQSIDWIICGGEIGTSSPTACIVRIIPETSSCTVRSHLTTDKWLRENSSYVQNPLLVGGKAIYLTPSLLVKDMSSKIIFTSLLKTERSVEVWSSLLPRLSSLSPCGFKSLVCSVDQVVEVKTDFTTPFKNKITTTETSIYLESFSSENLILTDGTL